MFKNNSRFAALAEEIPVFKETKNKKKEQSEKKEKLETKEKPETKEKSETTNNESNTFKSNYIKPPRDYEDRNQRNCYTNKLSQEQIERIEMEQNLKKIKEEKIKSDKFTADMAPENFPTLGDFKRQNIKNQINGGTFLDKIKSESIKENKIEVEDEEFENLRPGFVLVKKDAKTNKIIIKYKKSNEPKPRKKTEEEYSLCALDALVSLHEKRTKTYIEIFGYDAWETTFRCPNYDYEYFDILDQEYEEAMEKIDEKLYKENNSDFIADKDNYDNYWKH